MDWRLFTEILTSQWRMQAQNERLLLQRMCLGTAAAVSLLIGLHPANELATHLTFLKIAAFFVALAPVSLIVANALWYKICANWITNGDPLKTLRYLQSEYQLDVETICRLPLPAETKSAMLCECYARFFKERAKLKAKIKSLAHASRTKH
jgi:hypothetical protein